MKVKNKDEIADILEKKYPCYVLVTCDHPNAKGKMNVNMHYSGDPILAAYLLQGAQTYIEDQVVDPT